MYAHINFSKFSWSYLFS